MPPITKLELRRRFEYHTVSAEQKEKIETLRRIFLATAEEITDLVPEGREQAMALTHLEECAFIAIAGVSRPAPATTATTVPA